jgi:dipeptidyl aminopeptidase/acylaminoacyl peptidase
VFLQGGALMVQPFDADLGAVQGEAVALADAVGATTTAYAAISVSQNGVLAYARRIELTGQLQWFDRRGGSLGTVGPVAEHLDFELSPDETSLAMSRVDASMNTSDIWVFDLARGIDTRLTTDRSNDASPLWSPDGSTVIFRANRRGTTDLYRKRAGGGGDEERLLAPGSNLITSHWSADGRYLLYTSTNPNNVTAGFDIWAWPMAAKEPPTLVIRTALNAMHGQLSPDGKWVAYASDESDRRQVYVQRFPPTGDKRQISSGGGSEPRWRADGRELFFLGSDRRLMSAAIPGGDPFKAAAPAALFQTRAPLTGNPYRTNYTVTRDGQRFLVNTATRDTMAQPISVIVNWQSLVGR